MDTGDFSTPKNTLTNRQAELVLDGVLRSGYMTLRGQDVAPSVTYMLAASGYQGSAEWDIPERMANYWQNVPNAMSFWDTAVDDSLSAAIDFRRDAAANNQDTSEYDAQIDRESRAEFLDRRKRAVLVVDKRPLSARAVRNVLQNQVRRDLVHLADRYIVRLYAE